jgi:hypothetical protein
MTLDPKLIRTLLTVRGSAGTVSLHSAGPGGTHVTVVIVTHPGAAAILGRQGFGSVL